MKNKVYFCNNGYVKILLFLGVYLTVSIFLFFKLGLPDFLLENDNDAMTYVYDANNMLRNGFFSQNGIDPDYFRTPGYPLILSVVFFLLHSSKAVAIIQYILFSIGLFVIWRIGIQLQVCDKILWGALFLLAIDTNYFFYHAYLLTESTFATCLIIAAFFWISYLKEQRNLFIFFFSLFLNYALLIRPILSYLNMLLIVAFLILWLMKKIQFKHVMIYTIIFALFFGGWSLRNYSWSGVFKFSTVRDVNLLYYDARYTYCQVNGMKIEDPGDKQVMLEMVYDICPNEEYDNLTDMEQIELSAEVGKKYIKENFGAYLIVNVKGLAKMLFGRASSFLETLISEEVYLNLVKNVYLAYLLFSYIIYAFSLIKNIRKLNLMDFSIFSIILYLCIAGCSIGVSRMRTSFWGLMYIGILVAWRKEAPIKDKGFFMRLISF